MQFFYALLFSIFCNFLYSTQTFASISVSCEDSGQKMSVGHVIGIGGRVSTHAAYTGVRFLKEDGTIVNYKIYNYVPDTSLSQGYVSVLENLRDAFHQGSLVYYCLYYDEITEVWIFRQDVQP
ncbi:hypothetical protein [Chromobacterium haemolyticum]|uniref:hypothetical protein n=1 Tax=Chromobacterium haemolyticum TaxID=394935 RepID=UPI0012DF6696|nr:hypothetical protein [Chromobacterium haemolyticum]